MDISSSLVSAAVQKALSHSNLVDIPPNLLILISHLLLILQYVNIVFSGRSTRLPCSANVHCQARTSSRLAHTPVSTLSPHGQRFVFRVSILLCCVPWHPEDTQWDTENTSVCVHTANSTCVSQIPRVWLWVQISPLLLLQHLCLHLTPATTPLWEWGECTHDIIEYNGHSLWRSELMCVWWKEVYKQINFRWLSRIKFQCFILIV